MAVQQITGKRITKYDTSNPNFKEAPKPEVEVSGNVRDDDDARHAGACRASSSGASRSAQHRDSKWPNKPVTVCTGFLR